MNKKGLGAIAAMLLLVGGGCANYDSTTPATDSAADTKSNSAVTTTAEMQDGDIVITKAKALGNRTLQVEFKTSDKAANTSEGYRIILSSDDMPTWPTTGYWYQLGTSHTEKEWKGLPLGERQLRACIVENDVCGAYSQVMTVEVK
jgi:hypothetical protein